MNVQTSLIRQPVDLLPFQDLWSQWAPTPLQSPQWLLAWWSAYQTTAGSLNVLVVRNESDQPIGIAPFYVREHWALGRSLRFLGSGRACTDFQTLLCANGQEQQVARAVADWLLSARDGLRWSFVELEGSRCSDFVLEAMQSNLRQAGCAVQVSELEHTWRLTLTGGWQGFLKGQSKTQARQTRNLVNRFDKHPNLSLRVVEDAGEMPTALGHLMDLHQRRWNAVGQSGCFHDKRFCAFLSQACEDLAKLGQARIVLLDDGATPIAGHLYITDKQGVGYMYQSGRDPQRDSESVGRMLNALAIRHACEQGWQAIDFLRGNEIYKGRLGAIPSQCLRTRIVSTAVLPRLRSSLWTFGRELKHRLGGSLARLHCLAN